MQIVYKHYKIFFLVVSLQLILSRLRKEIKTISFKAIFYISVIIINIILNLIIFVDEHESEMTT